MTPQEFLDEFGTLAESAEGVPKLRELILELAVRGKLVEQDDADERASTLLDRLELKINGECPYAIPPSWEWSTLGGVSEIVMGKFPPGTSYNDKGDGVPLVNGPVEFSPGAFGLTRKTKFTTEPTRFCETGDLLVCVRGSTTGRTNIAAFDACIGRGVAAVRAMIHQPYVNQVVLWMRRAIFDSGTGSTFPSISQKQLNNYPIPVPPLSEQHRIVSKVDELMGLCDRLEAVQGERRGVRVRLNRSSLDRLTSVSGVGARQRGSELSATWQRVCDHFEVLYDTPETLPDLRQTILQLAVQGKLVRQDPDDEPAEVLFSRINEHHAELVKAKEIKRSKPYPDIAPK